MTAATLIDRPTGTAPGPGPVRRVLVTGLATGVLAAAVLTLVVFAGAGEHAITGSALLAFGLGWATLAVLSIRRTRAPQRWALVPAALMGGTGLGLLAFAPGDGAMTAAGWVWPPAALALAVWMGVRAHRVRPGRRLLLPAVAGLAAVAVGGGFATATAPHHPMPGVAYDVGGHRLHLDCTGSGGPTVVLENGLGETSPLWSRITAPVGRDTRICAYDRAGQGWSGDAPRPQDGARAAADLHTLLAAADEPGPYVLVGHSTGGAYALTYMARYPAEVAGMVLLDSAGPNQFTALPDYPGQYAMMRRLTALLPSVARLGVLRLLPAATSSGLPAPEAALVRDFATSPRGLRNVRDELSVLPTVFAQAGALTGLAGRPLVVVTAAGTQRDTAGWAAAQDRLATLSSTSSHRLADTTHVGLLDEPDGAGVSVRAITDVVRSVRTGAPLPPH
ncbi:MAG TPA: alpha/beta hydrolase [Mycobacteriales bacterium]